MRRLRFHLATPLVVIKTVLDSCCFELGTLAERIEGEQ